MHRLLCIGKLDDEGIYQSHDEFQGEPIDADVVVIDELSMVDMFVMNYLFKMCISRYKTCFSWGYRSIAISWSWKCFKKI